MTFSAFVSKFSSRTAKAGWPVIAAMISDVNEICFLHAMKTYMSKCTVSVPYMVIKKLLFIVQSGKDTTYLLVSIDLHQQFLAGKMMLKGYHLAYNLEVISTMCKAPMKHMQAIISLQIKIHYSNICGTGKKKKSRWLGYFISDGRRETKSTRCIFL